MQIEIRKDETIEQRERALLIDFRAHPQDMAQFAEKYHVTAEDFTIPAHRTAWAHLIAAPYDDELGLERIIKTDLGINDKKFVEYLDLCAASLGMAEVRIHQYAEIIYDRKCDEAMRLAKQTIGTCGNAAAKLQHLTQALESVPRPPPLDYDSAEQIAQESQYAQFPEIPERLLHVPGFIDNLVAYSMSVAYKPNRTLAFAGALTVLGHLAGRIFADRRNTRTNLYVLALGHSGIGKESPRCVNRTVMKCCSCNDTVFDQIASGEALEEVLYRKPCVLFQVDEIQKLLVSLREKRNANAGSIITYMNKLFTAANSSHTLRPKATAMEQCGRTIDNPSLSIFGTGIDHGVYQALTPEVIEDGLIGRCLIFDSNFEGAANTFEVDRPTTLPPTVIHQAQELAARHLRNGDNRAVEPRFVPYGEGVNQRIVQIFNTIDKRKLECNRRADHIGTDIWGRAQEKVSKLALIYTLSENYVEPVISHSAVEWAWELTELLITRMLKHIAIWMTSGRVDELSRQVMEFLVRRKGTTTRREVVRHFHSIDTKTMDEIERLLEDRGDITITIISKQSRRYTIRRNK